jgi:ariadne-1
VFKLKFKLASYIRTLVSEGQIDVPCPECRIQLEYHEIQTLMDDALKAKYESFSIEKALSGMNDIIYCPTADCSTAYIRDPENHDMRCIKCGNNFCADCKKKPHPDIPNCSDVEQVTKLRDEVASEAWIAGYTKPCPKCLYAIEKNGGCNHMTCN